MQKTKQQIAEMLKELPELYKQLNEIPDVWLFHDDEMEQAGLITSEEKATLKQAIKVHDEISDAVREAQDAIPYPDILPQVPEEYRQLLAERNALRKRVDDTINITSTVYNLERTNYLARNLHEMLRDAPDPEYFELKKLEEALDRKERTGTIVDKLRKEASEEHQRQRQETASKITEDLERKHHNILAEEKRILALANTRRNKKLQPIREKIGVLLAKVLKEMEA